MSQIIVYEQNGQVAICIPSKDISIQEVLIKDCPAGAIIIETVDLPLNYNDFFNALKFVDGKIFVNFDVAKDSTKDRLRIERAPLLIAQDVLFQRALEAGLDTSVIVAEKQRLRDITKLVDQAQTLDDLKLLKAQQ